MNKYKLEHDGRIEEIWKQETGGPINMKTIELTYKICRYHEPGGQINIDTRTRCTTKYRNQNLVNQQIYNYITPSRPK